MILPILSCAFREQEDDQTTLPILFDFPFPALQARIIHEYCRETVETEAHRGWSQAKLTQAYKRSVEEAEREHPRWARGSAVAVDIHEYSA